jgi:hypothetical protein
MTPVGNLGRQEGPQGVSIDSLDQSWIDMERVRKWVKFCDESHHGICHTITDPWRIIEQPKELLFIDVTRNCLVHGRGLDQYITLSYVWGSLVNFWGHPTAPFQTLTENFEALCREGAFNGRANPLPKTIQDSIILTKLLGCKYLWIDRFCIIQNDTKHKASQLQSMASIYANAYLTIVAGDGKNGHFGLREIRETKTPRTSPYLFFDFGPDCQTVTQEAPCTKSTYDTRGWTFQEAHISRKTLIFRGGAAHWRCQRTRWEENLDTPGEVASMNIRIGPSYTLWKSLESYTDLLKVYSARELTYPEDTLVAFGAIMTTFSQIMEGGILHGLPQISFDGMLLWQPGGLLHPKKNATGVVLRNFPSWSWAGWSGDLDFDLWYRGHGKDSDEKSSHFNIRPTITWYKSLVSSETKVPIHSKGYETYDPRFDLDEDGRLGSIPPERGGSRHPMPAPSSPLALRDNSSSSIEFGVKRTATRCVEHHRYLVGEMPPTLSSPLPWDDNDWSSIISCRTRRLHLLIGEKLDKSGLTGYAPAYLTGLAGNIVGMAALNEDTVKNTIPTGLSCEWIALSKGETHSPGNEESLYHWFPEAKFVLHNKCGHGSDWWSLNCAAKEKDQPYKFYNIMWIEWMNGIAYRVAIGRVSQEFWDSAPTEDIEVRLG